MAALSGNRVAWQYHADNGLTYRVAAQKALTDQGKLGGEAWAGTAPAKPGWLKMRRITVSAAGSGARVVPVYATDAEILTAEATINVNFAGNSVSMASSGNPIPENHIRHSVTKQST